MTTDRQGAPSAASGGGQLGVRTVDRTPPDVRRLAQAFIGVILARRFDSREQAGQALAAYPARPAPRRPAG